MLPHGVVFSAQHVDSTEKISHNPWTDGEETFKSPIIEYIAFEKQITVLFS